MKIQDVIFITILIILSLRMNPKWTVGVGIVSLVFSIPLFSLWVFFTAQRLTEYAAAFFLLSIVLLLFDNKIKQY